jgi:hypothetical protein
MAPVKPQLHRLHPNRRVRGCHEDRQPALVASRGHPRSFDTITILDIGGGRHNARNISAPSGPEQHWPWATKRLFTLWARQNLYDDHRVAVQNLASTSPSIEELPCKQKQ